MSTVRLQVEAELVPGLARVGVNAGARSRFPLGLSGCNEGNVVSSTTAPPPSGCEAGRNWISYELEKVETADFGWLQKHLPPAAIETSDRAAWGAAGKVVSGAPRKLSALVTPVTTEPQLTDGS